MSGHIFIENVARLKRKYLKQQINSNNLIKLKIMLENQQDSFDSSDYKQERQMAA